VRACLRQRVVPGKISVYLICQVKTLMAGANIKCQLRNAFTVFRYMYFTSTWAVSQGGE
jgi:hypothetical protein